MNDLNQITIEGRLIKPAEQKVCQSGTSYFCRFTVASNKSERQKDGSWKERASFFNVTAFIQAKDRILDLLTKGASVVVVGSMVQSEYFNSQGEKQRNWSIEATTVRLLYSYPSSNVGSFSDKNHNYLNNNFNSSIHPKKTTYIQPEIGPEGFDDSVLF